MEGLILMGAYVAIAFVFELGSVAISFFAEQMWAPMSLIIFMSLFFASLGAAWPTAVWLTRSWDSA